jgi:hypothetical protein
VLFLNILLRFLQYIAKKTIVIAIIICLVVLAAFIAYDCANIYIVLNEGMVNRASAILDDQETIVLNKFFTQGYLSVDPLLNNNSYEQFIIQDYNLQVRVKSLWAWPWDNHAKAVIEESIPDIKAKPKDDEEGPKTPPPWQNGEKVVLLKKDAGQWKIDRIIFKKPLVEPNLGSRV